MDSPQLAAARKEMQTIYRETGGKADPIKYGLHRHPEYLAAHRVFLAVLEAEREVQCARGDVRRGKRKLEAVK